MKETAELNGSKQSIVTIWGRETSDIRGTLKSTIFWLTMPYSPLKVNRRFRETYHIHLLALKNKPTRYQHEKRWQAVLAACFHTGEHVPPKRQWTFNRLHDVISQKTVFFITTTV
jgi:hypothetical protein